MVLRDKGNSLAGGYLLADLSEKLSLNILDFNFIKVTNFLNKG